MPKSPGRGAPRRTHTIYINAQGGYKIHDVPPEATSGPGIPRDISHVKTLNHGEMVRAITLTNTAEYVMTAGATTVKVWQIARSEDTPVHQFDSFERDAQIWSVKLTQNGQLVVGGDANTLYVWDLSGSTPQKIGQLPLETDGCSALEISSDSRQCFSCGTDGTISIWDLPNQCLVHRFPGHLNAATCIDVFGIDDSLCTGGLDQTVRFWDLRQRSLMQLRRFGSPIYTLGCGSTDGWVAVGLRGKKSLEVIRESVADKYLFRLHKNSVFSLKFAHNGKWFVSGGEDSQLNAWTVPDGGSLFQKDESSPVACCEITLDDAVIISGSGNCATLYAAVY